MVSPRPATSAPRLGSPLPATSAPRLGSPPPHLRQDRARPRHICTKTGLAPSTSAPGLGLACIDCRNIVTSCGAATPQITRESSFAFADTAKMSLCHAYNTCPQGPTARPPGAMPTSRWPELCAALTAAAAAVAARAYTTNNVQQTTGDIGGRRAARPPAPARQRQELDCTRMRVSAVGYAVSAASRRCTHTHERTHAPHRQAGTHRTRTHTPRTQARTRAHKANAWRHACPRGRTA